MLVWYVKNLRSLLEFKNLSKFKHLLLCQVCRRWSICFELAKVWRNIDINDHWPRTAARTVYDESINEYSKQSLDYDQATNCLQQIGQFIQNVYIRPSQHFVKLYQFFVLLEWYFMNQVYHFIVRFS